MVIDEGVLFHTKTAAYRQTKRKLLDECELWCFISLPQGVFVNAGAGVKTNLLFFTKGRATQRVWYYDMTLKDDFTPRKVNKSNPLTIGRISGLFQNAYALPLKIQSGSASEAGIVDVETIKAKDFDLKANNENAPDLSDKRTAAELTGNHRGGTTEIAAGLAGTQKVKTIKDILNTTALARSSRAKGRSRAYRRRTCSGHPRPRSGRQRCPGHVQGNCRNHSGKEDRLAEADLTAIRGMGPAKAYQLLAAFELARRHLLKDTSKSLAQRMPLPLLADIVMQATGAFRLHLP